MLILPSTARADYTHPDLDIKSVEIFRHLLDDDDFLLVTHYDIHYEGDIPEESAQTLFLFRLMDGDTQLGVSLPFPYYSYGYEEGCASLYFTAADAPTWQGEYTLRLEGNPTQFDSPPVVTYDVGFYDYAAGDTQDDQRMFLKTKIFNVARDLEDDWGGGIALISSTDVGDVLSATGEGYFRGAIRGLQSMCPALFAVKQSDPSYNYKIWGEEQIDAFPSVSTGVGETTADVILTYENYPGDATGIVIESSIGDDDAVVSSYNDDDKILTVGGLDDNNTRTLTVTYRYNPLASGYESRFEGTWVQDSLDSMGDLFGFSSNIATGILTIIAMVAIMIICYTRFHTSTPGLLISAPILLGGVVLGWLSTVILAVITLGFILFIAYTFFFKGIGG
jgi:hypothetical protein